MKPFRVPLLVHENNLRVDVEDSTTAVGLIGLGGRQQAGGRAIHDEEGAAWYVRNRVGHMHAQQTKQTNIGV